LNTSKTDKNIANFLQSNRLTLGAGGAQTCAKCDRAALACGTGDCDQAGDVQSACNTPTGASIMTAALSPIDTAKSVAAHYATTFVQSGMKLGLGTGSTAAFLVKALGRMVREDGLDITCVPTSEQTATLARAEGIKIVTLDQAGWLDLTIDGTDEYDPALNLIKGGGGAHLREKITARASDKMIVIADAAKQVASLGAFPLPVEVLGFGLDATRRLIGEALESADVLGRDITQRMAGETAFVSDEGNVILDLHLRRIGNPLQLALILNQIPGVVENGLFIDTCDLVILGHGDGRVALHDLTHGHRFVDSDHNRGGDNLFIGLDD
jgi:ribose 5-phosphate isomerase A